MNDTAQKEDLWGYGKRLDFVRRSIASAYSERDATDIRILDIGCGTGSSLGMPLAREGYDYTGIDTHAPSIAEAKRFAADTPNATFQCGPVEELDDDSFDVVILSEVLEHVPDPAKLLASSLEKLAANGVAIVTVPNGFGEFEWDSWLYKSLGFEKLMLRRKGSGPEFDRGSSTLNLENGHIQFFTLKRLAILFDAAGLEVIDRRSSSLLSGPFVAHTLGRIPGFTRVNAGLADRLPMALASGWFFLLRRKEPRR